MSGRVARYQNGSKAVAVIRPMEVAIRFANPTFGMNPTRFNGIEPGAFERQQMRDQAWLTHLFGGLIVQVDPKPQALAFVPTGIVPDDDYPPFIFLTRYRQPRDDKYPRLLTIGLTGTEVQSDGFSILPHRANARQGFLWLIVLRFTLHQPEGFSWQRPGG